MPSSSRHPRRPVADLRRAVTFGGTLALAACVEGETEEATPTPADREAAIAATRDTAPEIGYAIYLATGCPEVALRRARSNRLGETLLSDMRRAGVPPAEAGGIYDTALDSRDGVLAEIDRSNVCGIARGEIASGSVAGQLLRET